MIQVEFFRFGSKRKPEIVLVLYWLLVTFLLSRVGKCDEETWRESYGGRTTGNNLAGESLWGKYRAEEVVNTGGAGE